MLFGVLRERRAGRGLSLRGRVPVWCNCVDNDDGVERRIDVVVCVDSGMVNVGAEMSWSPRNGVTIETRTGSLVPKPYLLARVASERSEGLGLLEEFRPPHVRNTASFELGCAIS